MNYGYFKYFLLFRNNGIAKNQTTTPK
jgi:hypothetical protein